MQAFFHVLPILCPESMPRRLPHLIPGEKIQTPWPAAGSPL
jgi:hypothetical protein